VVESASLFDGPGGEPHLYPTPAQIEAAQAFASTGVVAVYDGSGTAVLRFPQNARIPPHLLPLPPDAPPLLETVVEDGVPARVLRVTVTSRDGRLYLLRIGSPLTSVRATTNVFYEVTLGVWATLALLLFVMQGLEARTLAGRIRAMTEHLPRLRDGDFGAHVPLDASDDELAELRAALVDVSARLKSARDAQDRLIANAAHELRTPLTLMRTEMDLALRRPRSTEDLREALIGVRHEVDRLADLATKLLDLAAHGRAELDLRPGDLAALVRTAALGMDGEAEARGARIVLDLPERAPAHFDPAGIRQAVDNLMSNALKFAPRGSTVRVRVEPRAEGYALEVEDEGAGVPSAARAVVFEPFFRASKDMPGAGLGLAITREIVERLHGTIRFESEEGVGTTFFVELTPVRWA
jgi:signal transduction histidine kinase